MGAGLVDASGQRHRMAGFWGWRPATKSAGCIWDTCRAAPLAAVAGAYAQTLTGHEFHHATILAQPDAPLARVTDANGDAVVDRPASRPCLGQFFHLIAALPTSLTCARRWHLAEALIGARKTFRVGLDREWGDAPAAPRLCKRRACLDSATGPRPGRQGHAPTRNLETGCQDSQSPSV